MFRQFPLNKIILFLNPKEILLFLCLFFVFFLPPLDPDLGWQLRCGQQIWQTGRLCSDNHFSLLLANYHCPNSHHLYQILIYPFYRTFGLLGLSFLNGLLLATTFFLFTRLQGSRHPKIIFLPLLIFLSWSVFSLGLRSQLFSLLYLTLLLYFWQKQKLIFLPLIIWLWTNTHGSFVLSLLILPFLRSPPIALISFLVTFLNPFGYQLYLEAYRHLFTTGLDQLIAEWVPPAFAFQVIILIIFILAALQAKKLFDFLFLLGLTFLALKARRNLDYFFLFAFSLLSRLRFKSPLLPLISLISLITLLCFGLLIQLPCTLLTQPFAQYPQKAINFLQKQPSGNIFNTYEWGGYLIWHLPQFKVFVDGRMPAWPTPEGKSPYTIYLETLQNQPGWEATLEKYKVEYLLISPGTFIDLLLQPYPAKYNYHELYRDHQAVIYQKL